MAVVNGPRLVKFLVIFLVIFFCKNEGGECSGCRGWQWMGGSGVIFISIDSSDQDGSNGTRLVSWRWLAWQ
jgi:hypothetical protein